MSVKKLSKPVWSSYTVDKSGKEIARVMDTNQAEKFMKKTGKPVFQKMKVYELRNL